MGQHASFYYSVSVVLKQPYFQDMKTISHAVNVVSHGSHLTLKLHSMLSFAILILKLLFGHNFCECMYKCKILNSQDHSKEKGVNVQNVRYHRAGFTDSHFGKAVKYLINHNVRNKIKEY